MTTPVDLPQRGRSFIFFRSRQKVSIFRVKNQLLISIAVQVQLCFWLNSPKNNLDASRVQTRLQKRLQENRYLGPSSTELRAGLKLRRSNYLVENPGENIPNRLRQAFHEAVGSRSQTCH